MYLPLLTSGCEVWARLKLHPMLALAGYNMLAPGTPSPETVVQHLAALYSFVREVREWDQAWG